MGYDYALVHVKYTIPPCILLTLLYRPVCSLTDAYKIAFLIIVAVTSTIPWDSYLIRSNIWSYPRNAVLGPVLFDIPIEELFFFVIQTYGVCLLYLCISKPTLTPLHLPRNDQTHTSALAIRYGKSFGRLVLIFLLVSLVWGTGLVYEGLAGSYLGLILCWALPFLSFLWTLTYDFVLLLPLANILVPIALPTIYLWFVDTWALKRGTWVIVKGTKLGINLWDGLDLEEAIFFMVTNCMVVLGLIAFDKAMAILQMFPEHFNRSSLTPSPLLAMEALLLPQDKHDQERLRGLAQATDVLQRKSRSFFLASSAFNGQLRIDLIYLYAYCRIADDLVDSASTLRDAESNIAKLRQFLDLAYKGSGKSERHMLDVYIRKEFALGAHLILRALPVGRLPRKPLYDLLKGFEMDLHFFQVDKSNARPQWPIKTTDDLEKYGHYVAGTVAELFLALVFFHYPRKPSGRTYEEIKKAGILMGTALQTTNIARDVQVDADLGRVYIPSDWLKEAGLQHQDILKEPRSSAVGAFRSRLLDLAFQLYDEASPAIDDLPAAVRGPMRMAVESYMEIGRVLREEGYQIRPGKATVPLPRRLWVGWRALNR